MRKTLFVAYLLLTSACVDQDAFGLQRRQLSDNCFINAREGDYYFEYQGNKAISVSELGWNDAYILGKLDHRGDLDNSPTIGMDFIVFVRFDKVVFFLTAASLSKDVRFRAIHVARPMMSGKAYRRDLHASNFGLLFLLRESE